MSTFFKHSSVLRILIICLALFTATHMFGLGYTPTDGGLVVNLNQGDRFLLSVWIDLDEDGVEDPGEEFFVCHYQSYEGGHFNYRNANYDSEKKGNYLKLIPQDAGATEPSEVSIWTIDDPVTLRNPSNGTLYTLDGIAYTMWSSNPGGDPYTLLTSYNNSFKYQGNLTRERNNNNICNAIFVVPTNRSTVTSFDPNNTMGRGAKFNGEKGYGFLGLPYREVYWLDIPRSNSNPTAYSNASVICFNTTLSDYKYSNNAETAKPGQAMYAFADTKHQPTKRTIFRLYLLDEAESLVSSCPDSYFFAYDEQDYVRYVTDFVKTPDSYTTWRKIYSIDRLICMERVPDTKYYETGFMNVPESDSAYFYVGYQNKYCHKSSGDAFDSQFKKISTLKIQHLGLTAPQGAYGRMVVDTTLTGKQNLDVEFMPGGYFLRTSTGRNIRLKPNADRSVWTCEEMWHITAAYAALTIKATMFTGSEFDEDDPGADIPDWSIPVVGTSVPVVGGGSIIDRDGWARIYINNSSPNGAIEFVPANPDRHIHYDYNTYLGDPLPDQYPLYGETSVTVESPRLVKGFEFTEWNTAPDGSGTGYDPGDVINLPEGTTTLYAIATYTGAIHVALSFFKEDGKRYFLTHPGTATPRFSRARRIDDWTNAWQGMANADNVDEHYINTFKVLAGPSPCKECGPGEVVLDPRRELRYGAIDSLWFYENFAPEDEEYLGLYYTDPNTLLANGTWAGLFKSSAGWPDYSVADVQNTKIQSTHYLHRVAGVITRDERPNKSASYIKYNAAEDQFDGEASEANATVFQVSRVRVADEHYVVIPDTTDEWVDEIVFGVHQGERTQQEVWSKLIGKKLMAMTKVGNDTMYFHPDMSKLITSASAFRLSAAYRLEETFTYIRDARVESLASVDDADKPHMTAASNDFGRIITSGLNTPMNVIYQGNYIDIVDTLRITLSTRGPAKIKEYYGRWKDGSPGLHINADGSRYRDIIVRTKTTHYGENITKLVITPEYPVYNFYPLADASKQLDFTLTKITAHELLDTEGHVLGEEVLTSGDATSSLNLAPAHCRFSSGGTYFSIDNEHTNTDHVTLVTKGENSSGINYDTLIINSTATVDEVSYPVTGRVPLMQSALSTSELVWSAVAGGQRYFIMAGSDGLIFRQFLLSNGTLYKKEDSKTQLIKGSANAENNQTQYITPWRYTYVDQANQQLSLRTEYYVNRDFVINGSSEPDVAGSGAATLTYEYVHEYVNDNANFEEQVTLKYGANKWLKFAVTAGVPSLTLTETEAEASVFSWSYLQQEYYLLNNGTYPNKDQLVFGYNSASGAAVQTRYKAYRLYSMLLDNTLTYCGREDENDIADLIDAEGDWKTSYAINIISDSRFSSGASGLDKVTNAGNLTTTVTPATGTSPMNVRYPAGTGPFVDIVDTLDVVISLQGSAPAYRFADKWKSFTSVDDAHLKIPLIRKTYHSVPYDSLVCNVAGDQYEHVFPATIVTEGVGKNDEHTFTLTTNNLTGTNILNIDNQVASYTSSSIDRTGMMDFTDPAKTEIRLIDEYGNTPDWCEIKSKGAHSITVWCKGNGIRSPRSASLYIAYTMNINSKWRYVNFRLGVTQLSHFQSGNNQVLIHSQGASGDPLVDGVQQVHENKNILYYYNPSNAAQSTDQRVELPIRERNFYGWWRWYSLQSGEEDTDIPAEKWETAPTNTGKYNFPFRIIGDSVDDGAGGKELLTQGRYTVFHYQSKDYDARKDPPAKTPMVYPPQDKAIVTYALDKSVYYDNLPLSMKNVNQVDTAKMDTMRQIIEPTLSLREIYELHPWTEMATRLEGYKDTIASAYRNQRYLEDYVVRAPLGNRLLLRTEQRYNYDNVKAGKHSESLLGYYMRDDNWATWNGNTARQDTMIWCGGWDADCLWYTYDPGTKTYTACSHEVTQGNDFLNVPLKSDLTGGQEADTVIYCLRARSIKSTNVGTASERNDPGDYWFNICRYTVIYHRTEKYGPKLENNSGVAIISNDEIEQHYEVLERLNFDYNKPGSDYQVYPHPLPWGDASYGFAYPKTHALPDNRPHNKDGLENLANMGEYGLINKIPSFGKYWYKMEQHGGAENGYMIFCDGMSSAGQVAAISLHTTLCEGQKMYFSAYVGNPDSQSGNKARPNFLFSVQGSLDGVAWEDITSYMTGDLAPSSKWYQIYFPIEQKNEYEHFRVRVFNMASNDDGNDFVIDDMCIFATKPPLIAYQANTTCMQEGETDEVTHVVLRVDYQGFHDKAYNNHDVYYTIEQVEDGAESTFIRPEDGYINEATKPHLGTATHDTIYGVVSMPAVDYVPSAELISPSVADLVSRFEASLSGEKFREGYVYENIDGATRPVLYIIHKATMVPHNRYRVRMSLEFKELMSSICAMTSNLKISNRMMLELNGEEQPDKEIAGMCANTTYDVSLRVRGSYLQDHSAPVDINGSCVNDWLHYGDTAELSSQTRYGYKYHDIVKVIRDILRCDPTSGTNANQFARNLAEVSRNEMARIKESENVSLETNDHPYDVLAHLVNGGFLTMYRPKLTLTTSSGNTIQYVIFPIVGTGSDAMLNMDVEVCPTPVFVKLQASAGGIIPMALGGFNRNASPTEEPPVILVDEATAASEIVIPIDSMVYNLAMDTISFLSTNDPNYLEGIHSLHLLPDREYDLSGDNSGYYVSGDNLVLSPAPDYNYPMRAGYSYTFGIIMQTRTGAHTLGDGCRVGTVPFTISVVPSSVRWDPKSSENSSWNDPDNWIGVDQSNQPIHTEAHFVPKASTNVIIPASESGAAYPVMPNPSSITSGDSIKQTGFEYNTCNAIRFLPGAAMSQQQHLTYNTAVVDLSTPHNKWALRAAPVNGMISGDIFMANADVTNETPTWEVGEFDANGRSATTGNASFWLSQYSQSSIHMGNKDQVQNDTVKAESADWARVTNAMTLSLPPAHGWAIYTRTASESDAAILRLPKNDDIYYYYTRDGDKIYEAYESRLRTMRDELSGGSANTGKLAFHGVSSKDYTLTNEVTSTLFVFGNPTMGYIDIWGFIADNTANLNNEFDYINTSGAYTTVNRDAAIASENVITNQMRYLPPMHALVLKKKATATSLTVTLNASRIVTAPVSPPAPAPHRAGAMLSKGIMTITAVNPVSERCISRLLLGQGYSAEILDGEDAVLTTVNIDNFSMTNAPSTPFNIYATEGNYGLSIDLRDEVVNVPISFYNSDLPYDPVTHLWFTGVNNIDGELVLYDALTGSERTILDGIRLDIPTPEYSHQTRYYIRRRGFDPSDPNNPTTAEPVIYGDDATATKIIQNGHVLILRNGHVYTMFGQKLR